MFVRSKMTAISVLEGKMVTFFWRPPYRGAWFLLTKSCILSKIAQKAKNDLFGVKIGFEISGICPIKVVCLWGVK